MRPCSSGKRVETHGGAAGRPANLAGAMSRDRRPGNMKSGSKSGSLSAPCNQLGATTRTRQRADRVRMTKLAPLAALLAATPLAAQAPGDLPEFDERTLVFEVQVPVNVVGRSGESVRDLTREDFKLLDEGEVQEISGFQVVDLDLLAPDDRRVIDRSHGLPSAVRRHFLLLFDLTFSAPTAVARARLAARDFVLHEMHATDLAAVAVHTAESGSQMLVTFTPDRAQLARAIATLGNPRLLKLVTKDPLGFLIDAPEPAIAAALDASGVDQSIAEMERSVDAYLRVIGNQMARYERSFARGRISSWADALQDLGKILGSVEGRKHVILFSEGFDGRLLFGRQPDFFDEDMQREIRAIEDGRYAEVDTDDRYGNTQLQVLVDQMLREFSRANAVIHAVDISGLRADLPEERRARTVGRDALFYIANETGGGFHEDANDFGEELREVLASSSVTYLLSFEPSDPGEPGGQRRITVRARAPKGSQISHRMGYVTPRPYGDLHPMEKRLLASDLIATATETDGLGVDVLAAPFRAAADEAYIPVIIEVGGDGLLDTHEASHLPVEIYAYVTDDRFRMRDFFSQVVTLDLAGRLDAFANTGLKYYGHLNLGPGKYLVRVLARNAVTGRTGVATVELDVPAFADGRPVLLPPFFLEEPGSWFLVREQPGDRYARTTVYPFTVNGEPYVPSAVPLLPLSGNSAGAELCLVGYNLGAGELTLQATLTDAAGVTVAGGALGLRERTVTGIPGLDKLVAAFRPTGLEPGDYTLRVAVTDQANQATSNSIPLKVLN